MNVLDVVGKVPPPYGGVSVHTGRLACYVGENGWFVRVFDASKKQRFNYAENVMVYPFTRKNFVFRVAMILRSRSIIHFHGGHWLLWYLFGFLGLLGRKVLLGVHTSVWLVTRYPGENLVKKWLFRLCCRGFACVVVPHVYVKQVISRLNLPFKEVRLLNSFIPPKDKAEDYEAVPNEFWGFIKEHNPVLGACAYRLNFKDGVDVYGLDMLISLIGRLKHSGFSNVGLVFVLPKVGNLAYFNELKQRINHLRIGKNILFIHGEREAYPLWRGLDLFIRPTVTDAASLSVSECLSVGVPVVASDCVERRKHIVTFKCRDLDDLERKVKLALNNSGNQKTVGCGSSAASFLQLYEELCSSKGENYKCLLEQFNS